MTLSLGHTLRSLRSRNYRLFFAGQGLSLIGSWMTRIATSWLVYRMTGSTLWLGIVSFGEQVPTFLITPIAGVLVDRWDRRRILVITQALSMLQSLAMGVLTLSGAITVTQILVLSVFQGLVNAFDVPARQSFVIELVEKQDHLGNAIALNSTIFNGARLIGPSIAGVIIAVAGEGWCFLIDAVSYLAVIVALIALRLAVRRRNLSPAPVLRQLREGFAYVAHFPPIRTILLLVALTSLMGMPYTTLMPAIAAERLGGGPQIYGLLMGATGLGAMCGALYLASRHTVIGLGRVVTRAAMLFSLGLAAFAGSQYVAQAWVLLLFTGFGMLVQMAGCNTLIQTLVDDDKRGRVMSLYASAFLGLSPFGNLVAGMLAERLGANLTLAIGGLACFIGAWWFGRALSKLKPLVHAVYLKKGILREVATSPG